MFPNSALLTESWSNVQGLFVPLLHDVAFDLVTTSSNITDYADVKTLLLERFGKTIT